MLSRCFHFGVFQIFVSSLFLLVIFAFGECWYSALYNSEADSQEEDYEALKDFKEIAGGYYPDFDTWDKVQGDELSNKGHTTSFSSWE